MSIQCRRIMEIKAQNNDLALVQRFSGRLKLKVKCMKLLVEVQSTMTTNYIDAAVYLCYMSSFHG